MAEKTVKIEGMVPVIPQGTTAISGYTTTTLVKDPAITGVYLYAANNVTGVVAANNYLTLVNPTGSGKTFSILSATLSCTTAGASSVTSPMRGVRVSAVSAGSLQANSVICKFVNTYPASVAEIRLNNPTATLDGEIFCSPPAITATLATTSVHLVSVPGGAGAFTLAPGEGVVFRATSGDVDLFWNLSISWAES
jgi:hypothetical protein